MDILSRSFLSGAIVLLASGAAQRGGGDFQGSVIGGVEPGTYCDGIEQQGLKYARVAVDGLPETITDAGGAWTAGAGSGARAVTVTLDGPYVDVENQNGSDARFDGVATAGEPLVITFDETNSNQDERDVFNAIGDVHDTFEAIDPGFGFTNALIVANVGIDLSCGASWNGELNFFRENTCANTGEIQSVVFHEFGHGLQADLLGGDQGDQGLGEGNADVLSNLMTLDPEVARGFFLGECASGIRSSDNELRYPEDVIGAQPHDAGRVIAGVHWDVLTALGASLGEEAGMLEAGAIWHFARKLEQPTLQPDQVLAMYIADDDNGDLSDGTPNCALLDAAARRHGFEGLCDIVTIDESGPGAAPARVIEARPNPFSERTTFHIEPGGAAFVRIDITDVSGRIVRSLVDASGAERRVLSWDGRDAAGESLPAGVDHALLRAGAISARRKLVLIR